MSKNKTTPLKVVERYYERYLEYENAFNSDSDNTQDTETQIRELIDSGVDPNSDEFLDKMVTIIADKNEKISDVNNAAMKFLLFVDFYLLTQEEELPEQMLKDYDNVPAVIKESIKPFFSVEGGKFVRNEKRKVTKEMKDYFLALTNEVKKQIA